MSTDNPTAVDSTRPVVVWDLPTRIFHWALAALIPFLWWSAETDHLDWHMLAGFAVSALIVFRVYWGLFGADTARFSHFLHGPRAVRSYLRGHYVSALGHNPLGGWSVAALLTLVSIETGLGLFAIDEDGLESGPLASYASFDTARMASHWHAVLFNPLLALIGLHVAAIVYYLLRRQNLIGPMITGRKRVTSQVQAPRYASLLSLIFGLVLAGAAFGGLWWLDNH
jgi:cytochrome b